MDVKSAGRTIDLFEAFARAQGPLTLSELARALNAPASSCFNLVRSLEARGYLYAVRSKQLYPTRRLFAIASAIAAAEPWLMRLEPILTRLRDATRETVILGKRDGDHIVYLEVLEGPQTIRYSARAGELKPLHSSSIGKATLAALDDAELAPMLARMPMPRVTPATIVDPEALAAELARGRARGYFVTRGENVADVAAVAMAITVEKEVYGVAVAGPMQRVAEAIERHAAALAEARAAIAAVSGEASNRPVIRKRNGR